jgi:glycosyltransferase involved in cell wall biosynthesis
MGEQTTLVYIINSLSVGGAEVGMCRLLDGLDENKYNVTVVALHDWDEGVEEQIPSWVRVIRLKSLTAESLRLNWECLQSIRDADIIVGSLFYSSMVAKLAGIVNRDATIATWRHTSSFKTRQRESMFKQTAGFVDAILADSEPVAETLIDSVNIDESFVHTVPIAGIDMTKYIQVTHKKTDTPVVGTVGRLTEEKNHMMILDVAERVQESGITFRIAGEGELHDQLEAEIENRGLSNVTLSGFINIDEIPEFLSNLDIYFQPSHDEGLCITVLEAMATGLPVVGSNVGGIGRNIDHEKSGFLYNSRNIEGFTSSIQNLGNHPQLRKKFGRQGRKTVAEGFTQEILASKFESAIETGEI